MKLTSVLGILLIAAVPGLATAAEVDSTKRVDKRQNNQDSRIEKGQKSGSLSERETKRLEKGQKRVDRAEARMAEDGKMTKGERKRLEKMQDRQSKRIETQRKDDNRK